MCRWIAIVFTDPPTQFSAHFPGEYSGGRRSPPTVENKCLLKLIFSPSLQCSSQNNASAHQCFASRGVARAQELCHPRGLRRLTHCQLCDTPDIFLESVKFSNMGALPHSPYRGTGKKPDQVSANKTPVTQDTEVPSRTLSIFQMYPI